MIMSCYNVDGEPKYWVKEDTESKTWLVIEDSTDSLMSEAIAVFDSKEDADKEAERLMKKCLADNQ